MTDRPQDQTPQGQALEGPAPQDAAETPAQRALRLKQAAARPSRPGAETTHRRQSAAMAPGASKPARRK